MLTPQGGMSTNDQQETNPLYEGLVFDPLFSPDALPFGTADVQRADQGLIFIEHNGSEMFNGLVGSGENSKGLQDTEGKTEGGEVPGGNPCNQIKWTDNMLMLMITALSYIGENDASTPHFKYKNGKFLMSETSKWSTISNAMIRRGYHVSSQQCEDKFNDLNEKYWRLNVLLGKGTACDVVENPKLIGSVGLSNEEIMEVMTILSCKQLFHREICSYNNCNRLALPHDESVKKLLRLALKDKDKCSQEMINEISAKRKEPEVHGVPGPNRSSDYLSRESENLPKKQMTSHFLPSEELKLQILEHRVEMEKLLIENLQEDLELKKMRLKNRMMELENQRLAFEIRQEMTARRKSLQETAERSVKL